MLASVLIPVLSAVIALAGVGASLFVANRQYSTARKSNALPVVVNLFAEHRGARLTAARDYVAQIDFSALPVEEKGYVALPQVEREHVRELMYFYDNLGALVIHGFVDIKLINAHIGGAIMGTWRKLTPLIESERLLSRERGDAEWWRYQEDFEVLHELCLQNPTPEIHVVDGTLRFKKSVRL